MALKVFKNKGETNAIPINSENLNFNFSEILNLIYPVGRGFIDFTDTDYSNYLGFTWQRTLLGVSPIGYNPEDTDFNEIGKTGGEKKHKLTQGEMPNYSLNVPGVNGAAATEQQGGSYPIKIAEDLKTNWSVGYITSCGGDQSHNNMHPYQVVAYWKRTA